MYIDALIDRDKDVIHVVERVILEGHLIPNSDCVRLGRGRNDIPVTWRAADFLSVGRGCQGRRRRVKVRGCELSPRD